MRRLRDRAEQSDDRGAVNIRAAIGDGIASFAICRQRRVLTDKE
jgi:hypothetical protein